MAISVALFIPKWAGKYGSGKCLCLHSFCLSWFVAPFSWSTSLPSTTMLLEPFLLAPWFGIRNRFISFDYAFKLILFNRLPWVASAFLWSSPWPWLVQFWVGIWVEPLITLVVSMQSHVPFLRKNGLWSLLSSSFWAGFFPLGPSSLRCKFWQGSASF